MKQTYTALLILLSITLSACLPINDDPKTVADKYWQSIQAGNLKQAEKHVSVIDQQRLVQHSNHITADSLLQNKQAQTIVNTTIITTNPSTQQVHTQNFDTVMVMQDGQWKIDLERTDIPPPPTVRQQEMEQLAEELNQSMQENMESLDEAFEQGMQVFNEALEEGSKEMGSSLLQMMNELNANMKESIEKLKQRRMQQQQQNQQQKQPASPDPDKGEGRI